MRRLIVRVKNSIEAAGLLYYFDKEGYETRGLYLLPNVETVIIDPQPPLLDFYDYHVAAPERENVCDISIGIEAIKELLAKPEDMEIEVGDTVVFEYDGVQLDTKRVIIVKEVDPKHIKGLDVMDNFAFKSFRRDKISNLKQVKA